jgi:hypothetical protein
MADPVEDAKPDAGVEEHKPAIDGTHPSEDHKPDANGTTDAPAAPREHS